MAVSYIDALNGSNKLKKHAIIDLDDLCLDKRNPRFSSSTIIGSKAEIKEVDIIEYLLRFGNLKELAESISRNHGLYDEEWISCYRNAEGKIVVLEGNRRIAACKILKNPLIVSDEIRSERCIPSVNDKQTLSNICKVKAVIYEDERDAQNFIAAKHTKPEIKRWETVEQCNYYYEQFINGVELREMSTQVGEDIRKVREKIKQFSVFKMVFNVVSETYPDLLVEEVNILPLVTRFMPPLISRKGKVGLGLSLDEESLTYSALPEKRDIFKQILLKVGEAFFVRSKLKGGNTEERDKTDKYRISSDEIKTLVKVEKLIIDDIRIPGMYSMIKEYKVGGENENQKIEEESKKARGENGEKENEKKEGSAEGGQRQDHVNSNDNGKLIEFFANINYSHLNKQKHLGLVLVCEEIKKISTYNGGVYKQLPIASAFLLRSLIEQVLSERLKQKNRYKLTERSDGSFKTPELGSIINTYLKDYQNKNLSLFWDDGNLGKEFNKCFSGYGTKDQLDTIVHNPQLIQPEKNFLNSLANQGLKFIVQEFLDRL